MSTRKMRLLALHGKGTSGRIMKTQIKPILDILGDEVEVHYMDGGELSAPYQGEITLRALHEPRCSTASWLQVR